MRNLIPLILVVATALNVVGAETLTVEDYFRSSEIRQVSFSPDGEWIAYLKPDEDRNYSLITLNLETKERHWFGGGKEQSIYSFYWLNEDWLVFQHSAGMFVIEKDDRKSAVALEMDVAAYIANIDRDYPNEIWTMVAAARESSQVSTLMRYDISKRKTKSGSLFNPGQSFCKKMETIRCPLDGMVMRWIFDSNNRPRIAHVHVDHTEEESYYLVPQNEDQEWVKIDLDPKDWTLGMFLKGDMMLVVGRGDQNTAGVYTYELSKGKLSKRIFNDENYDMMPTFYGSRKDAVLHGLIYTGVIDHSVWLDPKLKAAQQVIDQSLPGRINTIYDYVLEDNKFIVMSSTTNEPAVMYYLDANKSKIVGVGQTQPWMEGKPKSSRYRFQFDTEDGLKLSAYFTKPHNRKAKNLPLVVIVHGGPWARDYWSYDSESQYIASLGYGVLQVNFRGSEGYGKVISKDNAFEFRLMMDDIVAAIDKTISKGWADPDRIAVMGASFGGYASGFLPALYPEKFKCAVATMGVFDVAEHIIYLRQLKRLRSYAYAWWKNGLGDPENDADVEKMKAISPIYFVDQIKIPMYIAHGVSDRTVSHKQSRRMIRALKSAGVEVESNFEAEDGHGFSEEENRVEYYELIGEFLQRRMPAY